MKVKMLQTAAGPEFTYLTGGVYDVPDARGAAFVAAGAAECMDAPVKRTAAIVPPVAMPVVVETAAIVAPPVAAERPKVKGRKGGR